MGGGFHRCGLPGCTGNCSHGYTQLKPGDIAYTLARRIIDPVDRARDVVTRLGFRPYVVRLVWLRWTAGGRGHGEPVVDREKVLLPTPKISDLTGVAIITNAAAADEQGGIMVSEISGCYTEEQLRGIDAPGHPVPDDQTFFWEIEFLRADGEDTKRRRFALRSAPYYDAEAAQWVVKLERARKDRLRSGDPG